MSSGCLAKLSAAVACFSLIGVSFAQPANDACANAINAVVGNNFGSLANAAFEGGTQNTCEAQTNGGGGNDLFFRFVPPASGVYTFSLCQDIVFFDTMLSIHTGCPADGTTEIACDDDGCGFPADLSELAAVTLVATPQQPYIIRVACWDDGVLGNDFTLVITALSSGACCLLDGTCQATGAAQCAGQFQGAGTVCSPNPCPQPGSCCNSDQCCAVTFQAQCTGVWAANGVCDPTPCVVPLNDTCLGATPIALGVEVLASNCSAGDDQTLSCATTTASRTHRTVWYTFTPPSSGEYTVNTCGSSIDTLLGVFSGSCAALTEIACNDDSTSFGNIICPGAGLAQVNSRIRSVVLNAGVTYRVLVAVWGIDPDGGPFRVVISGVNPFGSCCVGTVCSSTDSARCSGTFTSGGTCTPELCAGAIGACCCGSTCISSTPANCAGPNRSFSGVGTTCTPFSYTAPCCRANFNRSAPGPNSPGGVSVQDIFDFLTGYFSQDQCADTNGSGGPASVQDIFDFLSAYFSGC